MKNFKLILSLVLLLFASGGLKAQISPGELSKAHADLEGVSNCTKCHSIGNQVPNEKCLACHKNIQFNISHKIGYHASSDVRGKSCVTCHSDHHGRDFNMIKINNKTFDHDKTGFPLRGQHAKQDCFECHNPNHIQNKALYNKREGTFLGLSTECTSCHVDFHQGNIKQKCSACHNFDSFKNAKTFDHSKTRFPLLGKHLLVKCVDCHKTINVNINNKIGNKEQNFKNLRFASCVDCHKDVHNNRLGPDCKKCHQESSWHDIKNINTFNHDLTNYPLRGKHRLLACKECHKTANMTDPIKHDRCVDCHADFHKGQFAVNGVSPDCKKCHSVDGFKPSQFTIADHQQTKFPLTGAHLATSCAQCHRIGNEWKFKNIGTKCVDCHTNIHKGFIDNKFMQNNDCLACHNTSSWKTVTKFDHDRTGFTLDGAHATLACSSCHFKKNAAGIKVQKFRGLTKDCSGCHKDVHVGQFAVNGKTNCRRCHTTIDWKNSTFDHNTSRFKIDGEHVGVKCEECHKYITDEKGTYVKYKFKSISCSVCHS